MQYLILGANGYIGGFLYHRMKEDGLNVFGTKHHRKGEEGLLYFDALNDSVYHITDMLTEKEKTAVLCIAQANIDRCMMEYELSKQINVTFVKKIINILRQEGFYVIYFSTDNVFDGIEGNYTEQSKTNAINQYGKMKEEIEHFLLQNYPDVCLFRLPKVLGKHRNPQNMLTDLENRLGDKIIRCIKGNKMSIVSQEDIYQACLIASERKMKGIFNLSSGEVYSRKELTVNFFNSLGVYHQNVVEIELEDFHFKDIRPLKISLDNSKFKKETGYEFTSFDTLVKQYLEEE